MRPSGIVDAHSRTDTTTIAERERSAIVVVSGRDSALDWRVAVIWPPPPGGDAGRRGSPATGPRTAPAATRPLSQENARQPCPNMHPSPTSPAAPAAPQAPAPLTQNRPRSPPSAPAAPR